MKRERISKKDFDKNFELASKFDLHDSLFFDALLFNFDVFIHSMDLEITFNNCLFQKDVFFKPNLEFIEDQVENENQYLVKKDFFKSNITFENNCEFLQNLSFEDLIFEGKVRIQNCILNNVNFNNTTFNDLADFQKTEFKKPTIFYKTDFKSTSVFSFVTFHENVLFTYSLLAGKTIFARTKFKKGIDVSQAVISGNLQLFNLKFIFDEYKNIYIGDNDVNFQNCITKGAIIPLVNKVHTFQILKKEFVDMGNYSDSILMQREEKRAFRALTTKRLMNNEKNVVNSGDKFLLWLNRWSNHYQSDFRNGIWFTLGMVIFFGIPTLISTGAYLDHVCLSNCRFSAERFNNGIKFFFNFLNPARSISYLDELKPYGIAYLFDFLGRIAVGYGFYQTIQAFRKFK